MIGSPTKDETGFTETTAEITYTASQTAKRCVRKERCARRQLAKRVNRGNEYKRRQRLYFKSFHARVAAIHEANKTLPKDRRISDEQILEEAAKLRPWEEEEELARLKLRPKADGTYREIMSFGLLKKARSILLTRAERARLEFDPAQYTVPGRGGRNQLIRDLVEALPTHKWIVLTDIRKCFDTIPHGALRAVTASPMAILRRTLSKGELNVDWTSYVSSGDWYRGSINTLTWVRDKKCDDRGCPQGLSASALVVDAVIADVLRTFERGNAKLFVYSDNIAIACKTKAEARTMHQALLSAFAEHPSLSGQVELRTIHDARRADYGFEHLGYKIKKRSCGVEIAPTTPNKEKLRRLYGRWVRAERARTRVRSATNDKAADAWKRKLLSCLSAFRECSTAARHRDLIKNDPDRALRSPGPYPQRTRPLCLSEPLRRFNGGFGWYGREGHKIAEAYERGGGVSPPRRGDRDTDVPRPGHGPVHLPDRSHTRVDAAKAQAVASVQSRTARAAA